MLVSTCSTVSQPTIAVDIAGLLSIQRIAICDGGLLHSAAIEHTVSISWPEGPAMTDMYWLSRSVPQGEPGGGGLLDEYAPVSRPIANGLNAITPLLYS